MTESFAYFQWLKGALKMFDLDLLLSNAIAIEFWITLATAKQFLENEVSEKIRLSVSEPTLQPNISNM